MRVRWTDRRFNFDFPGESLVSQRIDEYLAGNSALHAADMSNRKTHDANHNDVPVDSILTAFRTRRLPPRPDQRAQKNISRKDAKLRKNAKEAVNFFFAPLRLCVKESDGGKRCGSIF